MSSKLFYTFSPIQLNVLHDALLSYMEDLESDIDTPEGVAVKSLLSYLFGYEF